ncbi:hypothetical protein H4696_001178 [Amycolatopsis lexingtonensis]|uniref:Uncharacterized protein n=1 Tax=Amycolatopsis lexingtonensis TaxID=218822 RepID=A0ABR9HT32_9PSEU|nr:hypothetical protein [Amycolatopsis lexingtonensis]MBE1494078.1 hypothetical protein [Amycolatopsis lexingtonensis]
MAWRAPEDESWRRSTLITHHRDHPPQVKALTDELYATLSENGRRDYENMIAAEYAGPGERVEHHRCGDGVLTMIAEPIRGTGAMRLTHLVYGGCTTHQIRQDLVARGLGSLAITRVYPPEATLPEDDG